MGLEVYGIWEKVAWVQVYEEWWNKYGGLGSSEVLDVRLGREDVIIS